MSIALVLVVGAFIGIGYLRDDPVRNPAPEGYRTAICEAFAELSAGADALERGIAARDDPTLRAAARAEVEQRVAAASAALIDLPEWVPGRSLDEVLGALIITLTNGAQALDSGPAEEDLAAARRAETQGRQQLADRRYGFDCDG